MTMVKLNGSFVLLKDNMLICLINQLGQKDQVELNLRPQINESRSTSTKEMVRQFRPKTKDEIEAWLNQLPNIHILRRNPISRWVDFKTTHQLYGCTQNLHMHCPLARGNDSFFFMATFPIFWIFVDPYINLETWKDIKEHKRYSKSWNIIVTRSNCFSFPLSTLI